MAIVLHIPQLAVSEVYSPLIALEHDLAVGNDESSRGDRIELPIGILVPIGADPDPLSNSHPTPGRGMVRSHPPQGRRAGQQPKFPSLKNHRHISFGEPPQGIDLAKVLANGFDLTAQFRGTYAPPPDRNQYSENDKANYDRADRGTLSRLGNTRRYAAAD
jgi:hypothetical protein